MYKTIFLILISLVLTGCSGTKSSDSNKLYLDYSAKNILTNFEVKIILKDNVLSVTYSDVLNRKVTSKQFNGQDSLSSMVNNHVTKNNFNKIIPPEQNNALDAGVETLKINYGSNSFSIDLSRVSQKPETVTALLNLIFNYIDIQIPGWQTEAGLN